MDKVKETLAKIGNFLKSKFSSLSKKTIIIVSAVAAAILISAVILAVIMNQVHYAVLYKDVSTSEATEILTYAKETLGIQDIKVNGTGDILVPDNMVEDVRANMSIGGFPKSTFNYDVWNDGVSMFSTDSVLRENQKMQLQDRLMATLRSFVNVDSAVVTLGIPEEKSYVIDEYKEKPTAAVSLFVRDTLTPEQIDGMYNLVASAVPGLLRENITITDQYGIQLSPEVITDTAKEEEERLEMYYKRLNYRNKLKEEYEEAIKTVMANTFDGVNVAVGLLLDFDKMVTEETVYSGANSELLYDDDGNVIGTKNSGIVVNETIKNAAGGVAQEGGLVGAPVNADISPDYPTLEVGEDGEFYYEYTRDINNAVNEVKRQIQKDGYSIATLSAAVVVKSNNDLTGDEEMRWRNTIANAIGADVENVSIKTTPFIETTNPILDGAALNVGSVSSQSMVMIAIIVILGIVLIVLLILALNAPGSRKKRRNAANLVSAPIPVTEAGEAYGYGDEGGDMAYPGKTDDTEFELTSLNEEMPETRDEALKREIRDFSKNNPEIVAQLIRSWLRGED